MKDIPEFPIHHYIQIFAKRGTHDKITLFFNSKIGTVPLKEDIWQVCFYSHSFVRIVLCLHFISGIYLYKYIITSFYWLHLYNYTPYENKCFN